MAMRCGLAVATAVWIALCALFHVSHASSTWRRGAGVFHHRGFSGSSEKGSAGVYQGLDAARRLRSKQDLDIPVSTNVAASQPRRVGSHLRRRLHKKPDSPSLTDKVADQLGLNASDFWNQGYWIRGRYVCTQCYQYGAVEKMQWYGYGKNCAAPGSSGDEGVSVGRVKTLGESKTGPAPPPPPTPVDVKCTLHSKSELVAQAIQALVDNGYTRTAKLLNKTKLLLKLNAPAMLLAPVDSAYDEQHLPAEVQAKLLTGTKKQKRKAIKRLMKYHLIKRYQSYHRMLALTNFVYNTSLKYKAVDSDNPMGVQVPFQVHSQAFCLKGKQYLAFETVPATSRKSLVVGSDILCNNLIRIHGINNVLVPPNFLAVAAPAPPEGEAPSPTRVPPLVLKAPTPSPKAVEDSISSSGAPPAAPPEQSPLSSSAGGPSAAPPSPFAGVPVPFEGYVMSSGSPAPEAPVGSGSAAPTAPTAASKAPGAASPGSPPPSDAASPTEDTSPPAEAGAPDNAEEAAPPASGGGPTAAESEPPAAEGESPATGGGPTVAEVKPPSAEGGPTAAEVEPPTAEGGPTAAEVEPPTAEFGPTAAEAEPPTAEGGPTAAEDSSSPESSIVASPEAGSPS